ncbi:MAG: hypothetical protein F4121_03850 [Acidimicrobiia bacterium]|nr:hypothetical protein [Acidimicrobiia bacterium]MYC44051.1 hypothetical protein [Acidimicrobiia bacterium]MYI19234.1 hypothetical protein [Acidimicrobiia bacterium]
MSDTLRRAGAPSSRNAATPKTVTTEIGQVDLRVPQDRGPHLRAGDGVQAEETVGQ